MTGRLEKRERQLEVRTNVGLGALAVAALAEAIRVLGLDLEWIATGETLDRVLATVWIVGLLGFGIAFTSLWLLGQRLDAPERQALGDELAVFNSRKTAVVSFVVTYLATILVAAIPSTVELPGRAVALGLMAVATAALLISRLMMRP
jgi:hypothetical protein